MIKLQMEIKKISKNQYKKQRENIKTQNIKLLSVESDV
jgi:hypothetical protein